MDVVISVPEYDVQRGLRVEWEDGFEIGVDVDRAEVRVVANRVGLVSLARHLLTLAQAEVSSGTHLHLTADQELDSAVDLILERR
ncbi:hypothetical protein [Kribbella sp. NPDC049227]|uniref:Imm32 family immunity protein n=1 Tax=Kribbella sp. NPDC049227 TaxID=3364113 RepID=UPI00371AE126